MHIATAATARDWFEAFTARLNSLLKNTNFGNRIFFGNRPATGAKFGKLAIGTKESENEFFSKL